MSRTMNGEDKVYRATIKTEYFHMRDDTPYTMQPGPYEYTEKINADGPYTATGPARGQLKKNLKYMPMTREEGRAATERDNEKTKQFNDNPPQWWGNRGPQEYRDFYYYVTDYGIDYVEPTDWKRLEGK